MKLFLAAKCLCFLHLSFLDENVGDYNHKNVGFKQALLVIETLQIYLRIFRKRVQSVGVDW